MAVAAQMGYVDGIQKLFEAGGSLNGISQNGCAPIHYAASSNQLNAVSRLILLGANAEARVESVHDYTSFHLAALEGHTNVMNLLLEKVPELDLNGQTPYGTALHIAASKSHASTIFFLLDRGADVEATGPNGWTPLFSAVHESHLDAIKLLIRGGSSPDCKSGDGETCLFWAIKQKNEPLVRRLLHERASPNIPSGLWRETPLIQAVNSNSPALVKLLLSESADPSLPDGLERSPLHHASKLGLEEIAALLIDAGASVSASHYGATPLHVCAQFGSLSVAQLLCEGTRRANFNARTSFGITPLTQAVIYGQHELTEYLIKFTDVNARSRNGWTTLHWAVAKDNVKAIEVLVKAGASKSLRNGLGQIPFEVLSQRKQSFVDPCILDEMRYNTFHIL